MGISPDAAARPAAYVERAATRLLTGREPRARDDGRHEMSTQIGARGAGRPAAARDARGRLLAGLPVAERRIELDGVSTAVLEGGAGPPVVLLHGPGEFALRWMRVIPHLARTHRVVAPDLPDHGASEVSGGELGADRVLTWLERLVERTCDSPPALVGHLLGGAIALRYVSDHGGAVERLVLVDGFGLTRLRPRPLFAAALIRFLARPSERSYERFMGQCLVDPAAFERGMGTAADLLRDYSLDRARSPRVRSAMRVLMREVGVPAIPSERLARVTVPTTLIWGRHDRANRLSVAEAASARFGWPLPVIDGAADDPPMERPQEFTAALRSALDGAVAAPGPLP
jgi:pimeloyl-ACP methyl ester carboxylesterase